MNFKKTANLIRYNRYVSHTAANILRPVQCASKFLDTEIRKKVWINGGKVYFDGIELAFPTNLGVNYASLVFWNGFEGHEPNTWRVLRRLLPEMKHFLDIGSNIGLYAVLARKLNPKLIVDAFEPVPALYRKNVEFHRANGFDGQGIWELALNDVDGQATLYLPLEDAQIEEEATATLRIESWQARQEYRTECRVKTVKLDSWLADQSAMPLLMKIDVEDHEAAVLKGARETLLHKRPLVVCEILPREHANRETLDLLQEVRYAPFVIGEGGLFRIQRADFAKKRPFLNFLLVPAELVSDREFYFGFDEFAMKAFGA